MPSPPRRYCDLPWPRYAHRPGVTPHPVTDPRGHSYGHDAAAATGASCLSNGWSRCVEYLYGCDLYNNGYWWEAHEAWEALWQRTGRDGPQGRCLRGLIQAAACALRAEAGSRRGTLRLLRRSGDNFAAARERLGSDRFLGLDLKRWPAAVAVYYESRLAADEEGLAHDPATFPHILLETEDRP